MKTDITTLALVRLEATPELRGCRVHTTHEDGTPVIQGVVRTFYQKQLAHLVLSELLGDVAMFNRLEVVAAREEYVDA